MQNNKIAFILERRSDAGTSGGATLDVSSSGSDEEIPSKGNLSEIQQTIIPTSLTDWLP